MAGLPPLKVYQITQNIRILSVGCFGFNGPKYQDTFSWLVGYFGFNGPLRQNFSLYLAVSQRKGERGEKRQMRVKMSNQPPPAPTASTIGPWPTIIQTVGRPGTGSYPGPSHHPTTPWIFSDFYCRFFYLKI